MNTPSNTTQIIRLPELKEKLKVSRSTLYKLGKSGDFPVPVQLAPRTIGWLESEIDAWIEKKAAERA